MDFDIRCVDWKLCIVFGNGDLVGDNKDKKTINPTSILEDSAIRL